MSKKIIDNLTEGLSILKQFCDEDVQVTEAGNCLAVWNYNETSIDVSPEVKYELNKLGWFKSAFDQGWMFHLSG